MVARNHTEVFLKSSKHPESLDCISSSSSLCFICQENSKIRIVTGNLEKLSCVLTCARVHVYVCVCVCVEVWPGALFRNRNSFTKRVEADQAKEQMMWDVSGSETNMCKGPVAERNSVQPSSYLVLKEGLHHTVQEKEAELWSVQARLDHDNIWWKWLYVCHLDPTPRRLVSTELTRVLVQSVRAQTALPELEWQVQYL